MAIHVEGVEGSVTALNMARIFRRTIQAGDRECFVASGGTGTAGAARAVTITACETYQVGTIATSDASTTVTLAANTSGNPRNDLICMQVDLRLTEDTAGSIVVVQGTTTTATATDPKPKQDDQGIWQTPIRRAQLASGQATAVISAPTAPAPVAAPTTAFITLAGGWAADAALPLQVERDASGTVHLTGRTTRTGGPIAIGDTAATFADAVIIPTGFRPKRQVAILFASDISTTAPDEHLMLIGANGTASIRPIQGSLATNDVIRPLGASWITEV